MNYIKRHNKQEMEYLGIGDDKVDVMVEYKWVFILVVVIALSALYISL